MSDAAPAPSVDEASAPEARAEAVPASSSSGGDGEVGRDFSHIALSIVVPVYFNEADAGMVGAMLRHYAAFDPDLLDRTQFVIVDDGSPSRPPVPTDLDLNVLVARIDEDVAWNQPGARNLGVLLARSDKVLLTDLDHWLPADTYAAVMRAHVSPRTMLRLRRRDLSGKQLRAHAGTFILSRGRFLELYGFDEDFSGQYAFDDTMFWRWQRYHGTRFLKFTKRYQIVWRYNDDGKYHTLERDWKPNQQVANAKRALWREHGPHAGHSRRFLNFSWRVVLDLQRARPRPAPAVDRMWKKLWFLRWALPRNWLR